MRTSKISKKGQITIPLKIRRELEITIDSKMHISIESNKIILQPLSKKYFNSLIGIANTNRKAIESLLEEKKKEN